jgi:hypothetical protein
MVLLCLEVAQLRAANKAVTQRQSRKRKRIQREGILTHKAGSQLVTVREVVNQQKGKKRQSGDAADEGAPAQRRCGRCGRTGHNARTCQNIEESSTESSSEKDSTIDYSSVE